MAELKLLQVPQAIRTHPNGHPTPPNEHIMHQYPLWFGGSASCMAVRMQTATSAVKLGTVETFLKIIGSDGYLGLYHGISAGLARQVLYGSTRFAIYESLKEIFGDTENGTPGMKILIPASAVSGFIGGVVGNPADIANVRMQNDGSLPPASRRNYPSVVHALVRIQKEEGFRGYYRGLGVNCSRAAAITTCQLSSYDGFKTLLIEKAKFTDCTTTHLAASISASVLATTICSPIDVIKTQIMSQVDRKDLRSTVAELTRKEGLRWIFRGWVPSFVRVGPHTIATLLFLEQHRKLYRKYQKNNHL